MVSAFAAHQRLVLGQVKVADKSNEIVAIPKLLDSLLAIEGAVVTLDAIGCQRAIAEQIIDKKANYVWRSRAIRGPCARMSNCSSPSRKPRASRTLKSAGMVQPTDMRCSASDPLNGTRYRGILVPRRTPPRD